MPTDQSGIFFSTLYDRMLAPLVNLIGGAAWLVIPVGLVLLFVVYSGHYIVKGGGQFGIIEGYVGTIGAGKTTLAVQHALTLARARNALLLSNIPIICGPYCKADINPLHSIDHETLPMTDSGVDLGALAKRAFKLRDEERGLVLLMDEVGVVMPARLWATFSVSLMWVLQQSRKLACEWIWTAQDASFVDHQLRSLTAAVHYVRSFPPPSIWRRSKGKRPWLLVASAYTPSYAGRANGEGQRSERRIGRRIVRYKRRFELAFDTDGVVLPSSSFKGSEAILDAFRDSTDRHVIRSGDMGQVTIGQADPTGEAI